MGRPSGAGDVSAARALLEQYLAPTPLVPAPSLSGPGRHAYLKIETGLPTGSFKVRGAIYSLSVEVARRQVSEVVAASTGNHGAAIAYAGELLGIPATIFLPAHPNSVKADRIRALGARIVEGGPDLSAAIDSAAEYCRQPDGAGRFFLHDAADADVPIGTATIAVEIVEQVHDVDAIYVPMGDTALIRGVASEAKRLKPSIRIVGVAAERAPAYERAWRSGATVDTASADTVADGLAVRRPLAPNVAAIRELVDEVRLVSEEQMLDAMAWLLEREQVTAEPAGAAATAAWLKEPGAGTCVLLVTGGNVAPEVAARVRKGAHADHRLAGD